MNNSQMRVEWDEKNSKQIEEAKTLYRKARQEHRTIVDLDGKIVTQFRPWMKGFMIQEMELSATEFSMRIFDETGDQRLIWNAADPDQVKEAAKIFQDYITKGWKAYAVDHTGKRGKRIIGFSDALEELYFDETPSAQKLEKFANTFKDFDAPEEKRNKSEKLADFVKQFKQIKLLPKTYPG